MLVWTGPIFLSTQSRSQSPAIWRRILELWIWSSRRTILALDSSEHLGLKNLNFSFILLAYFLTCKNYCFLYRSKFYVFCHKFQFPIFSNIIPKIRKVLSFKFLGFIFAGEYLVRNFITFIKTLYNIS